MITYSYGNRFGHNTLRHECMTFSVFWCNGQEKGINLTHIESRPSRMNKDEYEFFISVDTTCSQAMDEVIDSLRTQISGDVHELSRNKQKDTCAGVRSPFTDILVY